MDDRRDVTGRTELCAICGEEVELGDPSAHAKVRGRTLCNLCAANQGGTWDPEREEWVRPPRLPEALLPRED
jgi:hypothetical protein